MDGEQIGEAAAAGRKGQQANIANDDHDKLLKEISDSLFFILKKSPRPEVLQRCYAKLQVKDGGEFADAIEKKLRSTLRLAPRVQQTGASATGVVAQSAGFGRPQGQQDEALQWDSDQENEGGAGEGEQSEFAATTEDDFDESDKESDWDGSEDTAAQMPSTAMASSSSVTMMSRPLPQQAAQGWTAPPPYLGPPAPLPRLLTRPPSPCPWRRRGDDEGPPRVPPTTGRAAAGGEGGRGGSEFDSSPAHSPQRPPKMPRLEAVAQNTQPAEDWASGDDAASTSSAQRRPIAPQNMSLFDPLPSRSDAAASPSPTTRRILGEIALPSSAAAGGLTGCSDSGSSEDEEGFPLTVSPTVSRTHHTPHYTTPRSRQSSIGSTQGGEGTVAHDENSPTVFPATPPPPVFRAQSPIALRQRAQSPGLAAVRAQPRPMYNSPEDEDEFNSD